MNPHRMGCSLMKSNEIPDWVPFQGKKPTEYKKPRNRLLDHITPDEMMAGEIEYMFETYSKPIDY